MRVATVVSILAVVSVGVVVAVDRQSGTGDGTGSGGDDAAAGQGGPEDPDGPTTDDAVTLMMTATDVGLSSSEWSPEQSGDAAYEFVCHRGDLAQTAEAATAIAGPDSQVVSTAAAGSTDADEIQEVLAVYESEDAAREAVDAVMESRSGCEGFEAAGSIDVEVGDAALFLDTTSDEIDHIVGRVGRVVWDVAYYGSYEADQLASTASQRAAGG